MNDAAHQEKKKLEDGQEKGTRREKTGRFQKGCVLPFCGRSGGCTAKIGLCEGSARGNWDPRKGQQPF